MRTFRSQSGHIHFVMIAVVLAAVGAISYAAVKLHDHHTTTTATTTSGTTPATVPSHITSKAQVQQAANVLNNDQTATQLDPTQLNTDLNSLL